MGDPNKEVRSELNVGLRGKASAAPAADASVFDTDNKCRFVTNAKTLGMSTDVLRCHQQEGDNGLELMTEGGLACGAPASTAEQTVNECKRETGNDFQIRWRCPA